MLDLSLKGRIYSFVKEVRVIRYSQLVQFFTNCGQKTVEAIIEKLISEQLIFHLNGDESLLCGSRTLPHPIMVYIPTLTAIDVLCQLRSNEVKFVSIQDYPTELLFVTTDNIGYDVTVFSEQDYILKQQLLGQARKRMLLPDTEDIINHIAVVPSIDHPMISPMVSLFKQFCVVDRNGNVDTYVMD